MRASPPTKAASFGFIYPMGGVTDVLSDPKQRVGLQRAVGQLSPGARYERYTIGATRDRETLKLEDHADAQLPYVGKITNEVSTQIRSEHSDSRFVMLKLRGANSSDDHSQLRIAQHHGAWCRRMLRFRPLTRR